jgi:hypothetical protein
LHDKLSELLDKQAIFETIHRYAQGIDRRDPGILASVFTADAVLHYGVGLYDGPARDMIAGWAPDRPSPFLSTHHHVGNVLVRFGSPTRAKAITYFSAVHRAKRNGMLVDELVRGRYLDKLVKSGDRWRIEERRLVYDWSRVDPADGHEWWERPGAKALVGAHGSEDPSVAFLAESD